MLFILPDALTEDRKWRGSMINCLGGHGRRCRRFVFVRRVRTQAAAPHPSLVRPELWGRDLNPRPLGYEPYDHRLRRPGESPIIALTSADLRRDVDSILPCLPRLKLSRCVRFTNRFTKPLLACGFLSFQVARDSAGCRCPGSRAVIVDRPLMTGHIPRCYGSFEFCAVAGRASRWLLLLLSPLLSAAIRGTGGQA
jgi:hypothetical protein